MGRCVGRLKAAPLLITVMTCALGCASAPPPTPAGAPVPRAPAAALPPAARPGPSADPATSAAAELPDGRGKQILMASCTSCHDLREVTKFRGYYTRAQWHDIVVTMVEYGADVEKNDIEVLADYLNAHLGRVSASTP
jgi:cytochrome c5